MTERIQTFDHRKIKNCSANIKSIAAQFVRKNETLASVKLDPQTLLYNAVYKKDPEVIRKETMEKLGMPYRPLNV